MATVDGWVITDSALQTLQRPPLEGVPTYDATPPGEIAVPTNADGTVDYPLGVCTDFHEACRLVRLDLGERLVHVTYSNLHVLRRLHGDVGRDISGPNTPSEDGTPVLGIYMLRRCDTIDEVSTADILAERAT